MTSQEYSASGSDSSDFVLQGELELAIAFYASSAVATLLGSPAWDLLGSWTSTPELSKRLSMHEHILEATLSFLYEVTDLLDRNKAGRYRLSLLYRRAGPKFRLSKFILAYGGVVRQLEKVLILNDGQAFVDERSLAKAFALLPTAAVDGLAEEIRRHNVTRLLEVGAGTAPVLRRLCELDPGAGGWAIDSSLEMVRTADHRIRAEGLTGRCSVTHEDFRSLSQSSYPWLEDVEAICARGVMNQFFADGDRECIEALHRLQQLFPGRLLFIADYYGRLGHSSPLTGSSIHAALQDFVQVLSGQGIPPADLARWSQIYEAAQLELISATETEISGATIFTHILRLSSPTIPIAPT